MLRLVGLLTRHQASAIAATAVDFVTMIAWVELGRGSPVAAAAFGAGTGAVTNFLLGRHWIYQAAGHSRARQAFRYALVASASLGLNSLGQHVLLRAFGRSYVLTRMVVATVVGLAWNFPLQRWFVFPGGRRDS